MGGIGSGRRNQGGKSTTSDLRTLDIRRLQRDGFLTPGQAFTWRWMRNGNEEASIQIHTESDRVILSYRNRSKGGDWQPTEYPVELDWTPCNLGGQRAWFRCPVHACGRRVAILYAGAIFACRNCHQLVYESQRETDDDRAARRADTIRKRLGWKPGIFNGEGWKPKGMQWRTFQRLRAEHHLFARVALMGIARRFNLKGLEWD